MPQFFTRRASHIGDRSKTQNSHSIPTDANQMKRAEATGSVDSATTASLKKSTRATQEELERDGLTKDITQFFQKAGRIPNRTSIKAPDAQSLFANSPTLVTNGLNPLLLSAKTREESYELAQEFRNKAPDYGIKEKLDIVQITKENGSLRSKLIASPSSDSFRSRSH